MKYSTSSAWRLAPAVGALVALAAGCGERAAEQADPMVAADSLTMTTHDAATASTIPVVPPNASAPATNPTAVDTVSDEPVRELSLDDMELAANAFGDRRTMAVDYDANAMVRWWATAWSADVADHVIFCVGTPTEVQCHPDGQHEVDESDVLVLSSGANPNGVVLLLSPVVTSLSIDDGTTVSAPQIVDLSLPSGRLLAASSLPNPVDSIVVTGIAEDGTDFEISLPVDRPVGEIVAIDEAGTARTITLDTVPRPAMDPVLTPYAPKQLTPDTD